MQPACSESSLSALGLALFYMSSTETLELLHGVEGSVKRVRGSSVGRHTVLLRFRESLSSVGYSGQEAGEAQAGPG